MLSPLAEPFIFFRKAHAPSWVEWKKLVSGVLLRRKKVICIVGDVHDRCSFISGLVWVGWLGVLFVWVFFFWGGMGVK